MRVLQRTLLLMMLLVAALLLRIFLPNVYLVLGFIAIGIASLGYWVLWPRYTAAMKTVRVLVLAGMVCNATVIVANGFSMPAPVPEPIGFYSPISDGTFLLELADVIPLVPIGARYVWASLGDLLIIGGLTGVLIMDRRQRNYLQKLRTGE